MTPVRPFSASVLHYIADLLSSSHPCYAENNKDCCTGSHNTSQTCPPSGVDFYQYFSEPLFLLPWAERHESACSLFLSFSTEGPCPDSYVYAYDESSGTALWTCDGNLAADYTVTFCP